MGFEFTKVSLSPSSEVGIFRPDTGYRPCERDLSGQMSSSIGSGGMS